MKHLPGGNIYWRDIPASARVEELRYGWAVHLGGRRKATAFWMGNESSEAQRWLRERSRSRVARHRRSR